uniref:Pyrin domain-containing protein n=1 Tax=Neolamprologus brichardi TaxID=32507 RepID=A0A3Q4MQB6_NEOBR
MQNWIICLYKQGTEELKNFKWCLQNVTESRDGFKPIKKSRLENADRLDTVDLMVQMYDTETAEVTKKILKKIKRNEDNIYEKEIKLNSVISNQWQERVKELDSCGNEQPGRVTFPSELLQISTELLEILNDLDDGDFDTFKWHLKSELWKNIKPIQENKLTKAERHAMVDLMVQKYEISGAVEVMESVLLKISRNDLVEKLRLLTVDTPI